MSNTSNASTSIHHFIFGPYNTLTTAIWIVKQQNSTQISIDVDEPIVQIMWYRFLLIIVILVTAAGNILVCLAIARERKLQNTTNYFLMSLAIADCLVALLVMPMGMIAEVLGTFPFPNYVCVVFATIDVLCCTSSIWHMSTMSMDRYFTIRFPFRYGRNKTRRIMLLKIIAVWAISAAISSPVFVLGIVDKQNVLSNGVCAPNNPSFKIYGSLFAFYIPFIIMVTTYALTMRSLRNVLVNKKRCNRERRRKQTFQPLAQMLNRYAETTQNIRHTSSTNSQGIDTTNDNNDSHSNNSHYTLIAMKSSNESQIKNILLNNSDSNGILTSNNPQYGSMSMTNRTKTNHELLPHNNQHLTINYMKPSGSKKRYYYQQQHQQQVLPINSETNRVKNDHDISTVFEINEYLKSPSCTHYVRSHKDSYIGQRTILTDEQEQEQHILKVIDSTEQQQLPNTTTITTTPTINSMSPLEDICSTTDTDSRTETIQLGFVDIVPSTTAMRSTLLNHIESISLIIPTQYVSTIIQFVLQYYLFVFPYRLRPLAITYRSNKRSYISHQSIATPKPGPILKAKSQSVSTQTNFVPSLDLSNIDRNNNNKTNIWSSFKRRQFSFNRSIMSSSSFFSKLFRQSPTAILRSRMSSTKSSISLSHNSPETSLSRPLRQLYSYDRDSSTIFRPIESEMDYISPNDYRPRASSSSSAFGRASNHHEYRVSVRCHRPLKHRKQYQSGSSYFLTYFNPYVTRSQHQRSINSTVNTNSSDSLSVFQRLNSKYFSSMSQSQQSQSQRIRDEHIVAANERKALKVLLIIFCVFVTLWTPFFIFTILTAVCEQCRENISSTVWFSITWLGYSSSMANPFIYTIFSDAFRRAFINIIFCRSSDTFISRQYSTNFSFQKSAAQQSIHPPLSYRRNQNHDHSRGSTPLSLHRRSSMGGSDATIYVNQCISDSFRQWNHK